jgi:hypothetical protein
MAEKSLLADKSWGKITALAAEAVEAATLAGRAANLARRSLRPH